MKYILEITGLTAGYYIDIDILSEINLKVQDQKITALIGPNGAGKSTLLKTIFGLLKPTKGKIVFNGNDISGMKPKDIITLGVGYIPQGKGLFPQMTVRENLEIGAWSFRNDKKKINERINQLFYDFPMLDKKRNTKATMLSGGEARTLEIAKTLVSSPKLLLIDEPSAGLMPSLSAKMYQRIQEINERGVSVLLVDQKIPKAVEIADYVYMINVGRNAAEGSRDLFQIKLKEILKDTLFG